MKSSGLSNCCHFGACLHSSHTKNSVVNQTFPISTIISSVRSHVKLTNFHNSDPVLQSVPQSITTPITKRAPSNDGYYGWVTNKGSKSIISQTHHAQINDCVINGWKLSFIVQNYMSTLIRVQESQSSGKHIFSHKTIILVTIIWSICSHRVQASIGKECFIDYTSRMKHL